MAIPSQAALEALEILSKDPKNVVYIISGRDQEFLELHLGHLRNIGFSAEHGGFVKEPGTGVWSDFTKNLDMSWMSEVEEIFRYYTEVCAMFYAAWSLVDLSMNSGPKEVMLR
jgi:trehalose 6-phosphate synthase/phosphatase